MNRTPRGAINWIHFCMTRQRLTPWFSPRWISCKARIMSLCWTWEGAKGRKHSNSHPVACGPFAWIFLTASCLALANESLRANRALNWNLLVVDAKDPGRIDRQKTWLRILTGAVILYDYGLAWAGTAAVMIGWPLVTVFVLAIAASMAELASAYPTAGGLYYWASKMKNKDWGWWTAWLNLIGQFAIVAGIDYAAAGFLNATILDRITGGVFNTTEVIPGILNGQLVTMGVILLIQLGLNIAGINLVALLNQVSVWWHIVIVAIVVVLVGLLGKADTSGLDLFKIAPLDTAGSWNNDLGVVNLQYGPAVSYPIVLAFFFSLLQANWTYTGYDASAHVAEETVAARKSSAWGIFLSVAVSAVVGCHFARSASPNTSSSLTLKLCVPPVQCRRT